MLEGIDEAKTVTIITNKPDEISQIILYELKRGVTFLDGKGAYSSDTKGVILTVIPTSDYYKLKQRYARDLEYEMVGYVCADDGRFYKYIW